MTTNQINYQKMLEDKRHNKRVEAETKRYNLINAYLQGKQIASNYEIASQRLAHDKNVFAENARHNLATEGKDLMYATRMLDETTRHNLEQEKISNRNLDISQQQINNNFALGMANVDVAKGQIDLGFKNLSEQQRHNLQGEMELNRHNVALERTDATKVQNDYNLGLQRNAETQRNNVQQSLLHNKQLTEQHRHNYETEDVADRAQVTNTLINVSEQMNAWFKTFRR